jgi:ketosteroid isomerase-like protein
MTNLATVERIYDAFASRDLDTILAAMHPDVVIRQDAPLPWGGTYTGKAGVVQFVSKLLANLDTHLTTEELISSGDHVVQIGRTKGTVLATAIEFDTREIHVWGFKDGLVVSYQVYIDVPSMLAALT